MFMSNGDRVIATNSSLNLTFDPIIKRGLSMIMGNTCLKYHHCIPEECRVIAQKPLFPQTYSLVDRIDMVKPASTRKTLQLCWWG